MREKNVLLLKIMYLYTIIGAGGAGMAILLFPNSLISLFQKFMVFPPQDPYIFGYMGSAMMAFAVLSGFGLKSPLKFVPVLMLQMTYKIVWTIVVFIPLLIKGEAPLYAILFAAIFATYIIGDLIAIPFSYYLKMSEEE